MKIGDQGNSIARVQQALLVHGYTLNRYGADGDLGAETWQALYNFALDRNLYWDFYNFECELGDVPPPVESAVLDRPTSLGLANRVVDITGAHPLLKGRQRPRRPDDVTTIVLHQAGVAFGTTKRNRDRYGEAVALRRRFYNVACHVAALRNGETLYVNGLLRYVWQGNVSNRFGVGLEVDGHYLGVEDMPHTISGDKDADVLDERTIEAARRGVRFIVEEGARIGCRITHIQPHRNYSRSRRNDCGEALWRNVALWAVRELGLKVDYEVALNEGRPVPDVWDPDALYDWRGRKLK